jgi:hypothetical protein
MKKLFTYNCYICKKTQTIRVKNNQEYKQDSTRCCYECRDRFFRPYIDYINRHMAGGTTIVIEQDDLVDSKK